MPVVRTRIPERIVPGKRLGRHIHHDPRSRDYAVKASSGFVSIRHGRDIPVLDQGNVGSCTGNAMVGAIGTDPLYPALAGLMATAKLDEHLALAIYSQAETLDGDGPYPPNDNGSSGLSVAKIAKDLGYIAGFNNAFSLTAALTALQTDPVLTGVPWLTGMDTPDKTGRVRATGSVRGGHEFVVDEIDVTNQLVWFTNSWGLSWGIQGRACMTWSDWGLLLGQQGDVTVPVPVTAPAPTPTPGPVPAIAGAADRALWAAVKPWTLARHVGSNRAAAAAVTTWAKALGLT